MLDELPTFTCWRCDSPCTVEWIDVSDHTREPEVIRGRTCCTNERCIGRFDQCADSPPSPQKLVKRGQECLDRVIQIATEV